MRTARRGISLVEMLIVMGLIAMLFALLMPAAASVRKTALQSQCANRLHTLGSAYVERTAARHTPNEPAWAGRWQQELGNYVEKSAKLFLCPEGNGGKAADLSAASVRVVPSTGAAFEIPLQPGNPRCRISTRFGSQAVAPKYAVEFEDGTDNDWNDIALLISPNAAGGSATVTVLQVTGNRYDLIGPGPTVLTEGITSGNFSGKSVQMFGVGNLSYGMNSLVHRFEQDGGKVVLLDYHLAVANLGDTNSTDDFGLAINAVKGRHRASFNVLFANGSVKLMSAGDIDPRVATLKNRFWRPSAEVLANP